MRERKKNGFVIEMMMIFMLITVGFCILITTVLLGLRSERKYSQLNIQMQTDLNQIGEYYLRYIEEGGSKFPTGSEGMSDFSGSSYKWMGDESGSGSIKAFFSNMNGKYKFETYYAITRGKLRDFFMTKSIWRKLVVTSKTDGEIKMIVELTETRDTLNKDVKANFEIHNWSVGTNLVDETADDGTYKTEKLNILQLLWKFIGKERDLMLSSFQYGRWGEFGDIIELFVDIGRGTGENWLDLFRELWG